MALHTLGNDWLEVIVDAAYGARVTSLIDRKSGRDWMTKGGRSAQTGEDAVYLGDEAVGWDECFPTVGARDAASTPWRRRLRDHGDLWGRPWAVENAGSELLELSYAAPEFRFVRRLSLDGPTLVADYGVTNRTAEPLPYLWALHALLAVKPGDRMEIPGLDSVRASFLSLGGKTIAADRLPFAGPNDVLPFPLDVVQPPETLFATKLVAENLPGGTARIGQPGQWLSLAWDASLQDVGIWMTYGAWPAPGGHYEVAIEPTSAPANDIAEAMAAGAAPLAPGEFRSWQVRLSVGQ